MSPKATRQDCGNKGVFQRVLVGIDASEPARWAIRMAANIAKSTGASVAFVHVIPRDVALTPEISMYRPDFMESRRETAMALLEHAAAGVDITPAPRLLVKEGDPSQQIIATAHEWDADVIVVGTHGRGAVAHMLLGSTAESVVRHAHAPVLTVGCDPCNKAKVAADQPAAATGPAQPATPVTQPVTAPVAQPAQPESSVAPSKLVGAAAK